MITQLNKMNPARLDDVILQDFKKIIKLSKVGVKAFNPDFKVENLAGLEERFFIDLNKVWDKLTPFTRHFIHVIL